MFSISCLESYLEKEKRGARVSGDVMDDKRHCSKAHGPERAAVTHVKLVTADGRWVWHPGKTCPWSCASLCGQIDIEGTFVSK